jgi:hypothetical protein
VGLEIWTSCPLGKISSNFHCQNLYLFVNSVDRNIQRRDRT